MKNYKNFVTLEGLLLITVGWLTTLSLIFEFLSTTTDVSAKEANNLKTLFDLKISTPPVTFSEWNHIFILASISLFLFGLKAIFSNKPKLERIFLGLCIFYFAAQTLALIVFGLYPLPAGYSAIFTGYSLYLFIQRFRVWIQN